MKASKIIERARSLADLQNSKAISYDDELNSINEAYKIIYNKISESDDDFYMKETLYTGISQYATTGMAYQYLIPLPQDFYKLRTVSYENNGSWYPMSRMPLNMRNVNTSEPLYRIKNNDLFIISGSMSIVSSVSVGYYPPPEVISLPDYATTFDQSVPVTDTVAKIYCIKDEKTLYKCVGNTIVVYTANKIASTLVYTGLAATTYPVYYRGLLYFLEGTALTYIDLSTNVKTLLTVTAVTQPFNVENNLIYYSDGTDTYKNSFVGGSETLLYTGKVAQNVHQLGLASYIYVSAGNIEQDSVVVTPATFMFYPYFNSGNDVYRLGALNVVELYKADAQIGSAWNQRAVGIDTLTNQVTTYSIVEDTDFTYPTNVIFEILAYQAAADFKRKYEEASQDLEAKLGQLWAAFVDSTIRRDEYKTEKIQNVYNQGISWGNL